MTDIEGRATVITGPDASGMFTIETSMPHASGRVLRMKSRWHEAHKGSDAVVRAQQKSLEYLAALNIDEIEREFPWILDQPVPATSQPGPEYIGLNEDGTFKAPDVSAELR